MIVIGNGESRSGIDLTSISDKKIGCNAAYRDITLDHLVCVDKGILRDAVAKANTNIWTRPELAILPSLNPLPEVPVGNQRADNTRHWGSGAYAVLLAAHLSQTIHMIGFDLYGNDTFINNVYKNTEYYNPSTAHAVDPRYWIYQIARVFTTFDNKYFTVYNKSNWQMPREWCLANVKFDLLDNLSLNV